MSNQAFHLIAIVLYFIAMLAIGYYAFRKTTDHEGYMIAGRSFPGWVAALSAGASDMSGWLMMGLPGAVYVSGLVDGWIAVSLTIGMYLNWRLIAPRLRAYTEVSGNSITIPSFLENRFKAPSRRLRLISGFTILVFFTFYVSAMMVAGGVFLEASFGTSYLTGMILVAAVTMLYTLFGGFLGASLTDVMQGLLMMLALLIVPLAAVIQLGGPGETVSAIREIDPAHFSLVGDSSTGVAAVFVIISALTWGMGYFGQPHIIIRFMAMRNPATAVSGRRIGISWMAISLIGSVAGGLIGVAYFERAGVNLDDPETVLLAMSEALLHPIVAGFIFAAVLAAIMSTVSSQLIVCSSALVEDIYTVFARHKRSSKFLLRMGRFGVLVVAIVAILLAINPSDTILSLVGFAWAGFGAAFGPIILLSLFWRKLTELGTVSGMATGAVVVFVWSALDTPLYELGPGFVASLLVAVVVSKFTYHPNPTIDREFTLAMERARRQKKAVETTGGLAATRVPPVADDVPNDFDASR